MILRNLVLSDKNFRQELKNKLVSDRTIKSLTLCNISHRSSISLDFLTGNNDNDSVSVNEEATASTATGIEELIIERCHLDIDGCKAIGQVLSSSSTKLKSFKMIHVTLLLNIENDDNDDNESCITPIIDGINQAGRNGWLESIDFQRIVTATTTTPTTTMMVGSGNTQTQLRRLFTSSFKNCINLRSLRLSDCNIGCRSTTTDHRSARQRPAGHRITTPPPPHGRQGSRSGHRGHENELRPARMCPGQETRTSGGLHGSGAAGRHAYHRRFAGNTHAR